MEEQSLTRSAQRTREEKNQHISLRAPPCNSRNCSRPATKFPGRHFQYSRPSICWYLLWILAALARRRSGSGFGRQSQNPPQHGNGHIKPKRELSPLLSSFPDFLSNKSSCAWSRQLDSEESLNPLIHPLTRPPHFVTRPVTGNNRSNPLLPFAFHQRSPSSLLPPRRY
jgi:hypothetical protein